ncbi:Cof-type HAD-IIB family hydrolase [Paenibacillus sp. YYML68]|uniref:Cof-type HAD-IIB family hydrolase n=1 Tax=Paenibacillus sp. YYML68 TaxID=2909250 RepID=UPI0024923115|nr:Cof-type HAD-IIB family hydrolase [Paenibacillus sp. YYML68]
MKPYRLIALDMDGTLLTEEKTVSDANRAAIQDAVAAGITVMFATGRGIHSALPYAEELGLTSPLVTVNGSEVWKAPGELLERHRMDVEDIRSMRQLVLDDEPWYWAYSTEGVFNRDNWHEIKDEEALVWMKLGYYTEDAKKLASLREQLEATGRYAITNSHPCNIEMNPKGVSKASGLHRVCELLGIDMSQVIAMGDSLNDETMIREAGLGVAMGNAQDEVKSFADVVTLTNEEDGVAHIIRKYALS